VFDLGAYEYEGAGGYYTCDDRDQLVHRRPGQLTGDRLSARALFLMFNGADAEASTLYSGYENPLK